MLKGATAASVIAVLVLATLSSGAVSAADRAPRVRERDKDTHTELRVNGQPVCLLPKGTHRSETGGGITAPTPVGEVGVEGYDAEEVKWGFSEAALDLALKDNSLCLEYYAPGTSSARKAEIQKLRDELRKGPDLEAILAADAALVQLKKDLDEIRVRQEEAEKRLAELEKLVGEFQAQLKALRDLVDDELRRNRKKAAKIRDQINQLEQLIDKLESNQDELREHVRALETTVADDDDETTGSDASSAGSSVAARAE